MGDEDTDSLANEQPSDDLSEQTDGEGAMIMLTNVVNDEGLAAPLFTYNRYDYADADLQSDAGLYGSTRRDIIAVQLRMLVDLNPARTPVYADLRGTAQLRNAR